MRIKTYTADNMVEAMALVRDELGDDAIIISMRDVPEGVEVAAALEETTDAVDDEVSEVLTGAPSLGQRRGDPGSPAQPRLPRGPGRPDRRRGAQRRYDGPGNGLRGGLRPRLHPSPRCR